MGYGAGEDWAVKRDPRAARAAMSGGAPTLGADPTNTVVYLDNAGNARTYFNPLGVYALELDRRTPSGPIRVAHEKVLFPGEVYILGGADRADLEIQSAYSRLPFGDATRIQPTAGRLARIVNLICHRHPATIPPTATRSLEVTWTSIARFPLLAAQPTTREVVQVVADGFSCVEVLAWARTGAAAWSAFVELVWVPKLQPGTIEHVEAQAAVGVPIGDGAGIEVYRGPTKGASIVRLVANIPANDTQAYGEIRLTA